MSIAYYHDNLKCKSSVDHKYKYSLQQAYKSGLGHGRQFCLNKGYKQAGADITGQLQVWPMLYTLYIDINLQVVKMIHTDNKQQITKWIQSPSKRHSYVTPGGVLQFRPMVYTLH